jgi:DNA polymerase/3'-5' exonuclease PolX
MMGVLKTGKRKYPRADALAVAREMVKWLTPHCERIICAGSLRRRKLEVGDVEILFIPKRLPMRDGLFDIKWFEQTEIAFAAMFGGGLIPKRRNSFGSETWGEKNRLAVHVGSGIPVDFFLACEANWFNYLVCRTGSAESNVRIASTAQARGWKWNPFGTGFTDEEGNLVRVEAERDVFELLGLPYLEPWKR